MGVIKIVFTLLTVSSLHFASAQNMVKKQSTPFKALIGEWAGKGFTYYDNKKEKITDDIYFTSGMSEKMLKFKLTEDKGPLVIEGYLYHKGSDEYEFHEFNNGVWPVRHFYGVYEKNIFLLKEKTDDREILLEIIINNENLLSIKEYKVLGNGKLKLFVDEKLERVK